MLTDIWSHCDRPATTEYCDCGIETCHAVFCSKCNVMLADYDHKETL